MLHTNLGINEKNHLTIAGVDTVTLAEKYGTPLMVIDEERIRRNCRIYKEAMKKYFLHCEKLTGIFASGNSVTLEVVEDLTVEKRESMISRISKIFNEAEMKKLGGYLDEARKLTGEDSIERKRVEFIATGYLLTQNRIEFNKKFSAAPNRAAKLKLSQEQHKYFWELYKKHPFAFNLTRIAGSQYTSYWRHAGWKPSEIK